MDKDKRKAFTDLLRKMSKKGFYETLEFVCEKGSVYYAEILKYSPLPTNGKGVKAVARPSGHGKTLTTYICL